LLLAGVVSFLFSFQFFTRPAAILSVDAAIDCTHHFVKAA